METTDEMNWQLLIKMVSSFAQASPPRSLRFSLWFVENRPRAGRTGSVLLLGGSRLRENGGAMKEQEEEEKKREGGTKGGFRSWSSGDAVSILFVHANYSSSVTLLEIEGTGTPRPFPRSRRHRHRRRCRHLFLLLPLFLSCQPSLLFPSFPRAHHRGSLFSFLPARSSLPCPGGFLMDPDYVAFYLPFLLFPLTYYPFYRSSPPFFPLRAREISLSLPEDFTKDFNFPATLPRASAPRRPSSPPSFSR